MRKAFTTITVAIAIAIQGCNSTLYLSTSIDPHRSLVIGDSVHSAFEAKLTNLSGTDLKVVRRRGSETSEINTLKSGDKMHIDVGKGSEVVISNKSRQKSEIRANIKTVDNSPVRSKTEEID